MCAASDRLKEIACEQRASIAVRQLARGVADLQLLRAAQVEMNYIVVFLR